MKNYNMDETVNDFLKEINKILPEDHILKKAKQKDCDWQKCFDEKSCGYYYWNRKTNQVTWKMPAEYKQFLDKNPAKQFVGPPVPDDVVKIYRISEENANVNKKTNLLDTQSEISNKIIKTNELPEEKVILTSYGSSTESDDDENSDNKVNNAIVKNENSFTAKQKIENNDDIREVTDINVNKKTVNNLSSFALVAGYGSESDEDDNEVQSSKSITTTHSPLFPIVEPLDVNQFCNKTDNDETKANSEELETIDVKAFKRKRRIGVQLINTGKKLLKTNQCDPKGNNDESQTQSDIKKMIKYPGFKSGGVLFTKQENTDAEDVNIVKKVEPKISNEENTEAIDNIEKIKQNLKEKLNFLNEGKEAISAVQIMLIQIETLYDAFQSGSLMSTYLSKWLDDMSSELIKLEQDATPVGWLLQWDRSQKRYFYCNKETGQTQWDYPESDLNASDDAMDISTTPPPPEDVNNKIIEIIAPPPPKLGRIVTPPPPIISFNNSDKESTQPLPPGINENDFESEKFKTDVNNDSITSALNSFYSDIAAIESVAQETTEPIETTKPIIENDFPLPTTNPKKKKTKVKLSQGLAMKKKGVSKLVEKWKNLQQSYD